MDIIEFGKIVRNIRETKLKLSQEKFAAEINSSQTLISRLERGAGSTVYMIFDILEFFRKNKIQIHLIFVKPYDIKDICEGGSLRKKVN